ncbi:MAG: M23 family metallopeptidase [Myxococcota bacterium]
MLVAALLLGTSAWAGPKKPAPTDEPAAEEVPADEDANEAEEAAPTGESHVLIGILGPEGEALGALMGESLDGFGGLGVRPTGGAVDKAKVDVQYDKAREDLTIRNDKAYPVTVVVDLGKAENVRMSPGQPFETVLEAGQSTVVRFLPTGTKKPYYYYSWSWTSGSNKAVHKPKKDYLLPWPASMDFECTQGFDGGYSHEHEHALDIVMPEGTPILAAREGRVISIVDGWGPGAPDRKYLDEANSVRILHDDGTYADYLHLRAGGMKVALGDEVKRGQPIAESGNSGFSRRPHLHFAVKSALDGWMTRTWPVRFDVNGESLILRPSKWYPYTPKKSD